MLKEKNVLSVNFDARETNATGKIIFSGTYVCMLVDGTALVDTNGLEMFAGVRSLTENYAN